MQFGQQCKERQHEPLSACDPADVQNSDSRDDAGPEAVRAKAYRIVEQLWWQAETAARHDKLTARPNWGERLLHQNERGAIDALIAYQAETTGISAFKIEREMLRLFGAAEMTAIKAWNFDEVIRYLTEYGDQLDRSGASRR
jgi:hypothetical protein